jgi:putative MATE family efflux protein
MTTTDDAAPAPGRLWHDIREAIRGSHHQDYTEGPIGRALLLLAVPMVMEMVVESVFAVVDIFWVSRLGADAVATVALTESMLAIVYTVAIGLSIGITAMVARRIGEKDPEQAAHTAVQGIAVGVIVALLMAATGVILAPRLLGLMGASPWVLEHGVGYPRVMLGGNLVIVLIILINAIFRGAGDAAIAMRVLWFANILNIVLGPCFIFGLGPFPELGVTGAGVATTIGRGSGVLYQLYCLTRSGGRVTVGRRHLTLDVALMWRLMKLSATGTFQVLIGTASWIGLIRVVSTFGRAALAGYAIAIRIMLFVLLPSWGLSNAAATMVGQNLGAQKPERAERAVWQASFYNMLVLTAVGTCFVLFAGALVHLFVSDPQVHEYGARGLRIVSLGFPFYAYGMVLASSFNGAGDTWTPTWLNLFCFWLWEIPLAFVLSRRLGMGPAGVFAAIAIAYSALAVASAVLFRQGRWKTRRV